MKTIQGFKSPAADNYHLLNAKRIQPKKSGRLSCYNVGSIANGNRAMKTVDSSLKQRSKVLFKKDVVPKEIDIKLKVPVRNQGKDGMSPILIQSYMDSEEQQAIEKIKQSKITENSVNEKV